MTYLRTVLKSLINKNKKKIKLFSIYEKKKNILKYFIYSSYFSKYKKSYLNLIYFLIPPKSSISKLKKICVITGRSRGIYSKYKVSRHYLKKAVNQSKYYSLKKK